MNYDIALVAALWAATTVFTIGAIRSRPRHTAAPSVRPATRDDIREALNDPTTPPLVKAIIADAAHHAGLCDCEPYDQDAPALTDLDIDWLHSQGDAS